jgi:hypothetical protein
MLLISLVKTLAGLAFNAMCSFMVLLGNAEFRQWLRRIAFNPATYLSHNLSNSLASFDLLRLLGVLQLV